MNSYFVIWKLVNNNNVERLTVMYNCKICDALLCMANNFSVIELLRHAKYKWFLFCKTIVLYLYRQWDDRNNIHSIIFLIVFGDSR